MPGYVFRIPYINVGFTRKVSFAMNARIATQAGGSWKSLISEKTKEKSEPYKSRSDCSTSHFVHQQHTWRPVYRDLKTTADKLTP